MICFNADDTMEKLSKSYLDENWKNNEGIQVKALKAMIDRVLEPFDADYEFNKHNVIKKLDYRNWNWF